MIFLEITVLNGKQQTQQEIQYREVHGTPPNIPIHDVFKLKTLYKYIKCVCKFQYLQGVKFPKFSAGTDRSLHIICAYMFGKQCVHITRSLQVFQIFPHKYFVMSGTAILPPVRLAVRHFAFQFGCSHLICMHKRGKWSMARGRRRVGGTVAG